MEKPPLYSQAGHHYHSPQQQHQGYEPIATEPPPYSAPQQQAGYSIQNQYEGGYQNQGYPPQNPGYPPQGQGYTQQPVGFSSQSTNTTTVVIQGRNQAQLPAGVNPIVKDRLVLSILVCIFCCWPIGICAIMKSSEARSRYMAGDYAEAVASARTARNLAIASLVCGLIINTFVIVTVA